MLLREPGEGSRRWQELERSLSICHNFVLDGLVPLGCLLPAVSLRIDRDGSV